MWGTGGSIGDYGYQHSSQQMDNGDPFSLHRISMMNNGEHVVALVLCILHSSYISLHVYRFHMFSSYYCCQYLVCLPQIGVIWGSRYFEVFIPGRQVFHPLGRSSSQDSQWWHCLPRLQFALIVLSFSIYQPSSLPSMLHTLLPHHHSIPKPSQPPTPPTSRSLAMSLFPLGGFTKWCS